MPQRPPLRFGRARPCAAAVPQPRLRCAGLAALAAWCAVSAAAPAALAQDVPGIELCSKEAGMERRTGCLQSNVEFLQKVITKNALDTQQKLVTANHEITALRDQLAAASRESAALKEKLAALEARIGRLEKPAARPEPKPEARPDK